ncbi:MAG: hypothetical protein JOS17DRAFT_62925 [Linnemannia elongata]|nr:MAG: hypothetical protein JOS17DRAFT_62925 [Linnemannia elongata]
MEAQGRQLQPDDIVFPTLDAKGRIKYQEALSQPRIQDWLDQLTNQSGVLAKRIGRFTTHCFRRGGAQFRFMFAKEKWPLKAVKWWGAGRRAGRRAKDLAPLCTTCLTSTPDMRWIFATCWHRRAGIVGTQSSWASLTLQPLSAYKPYQSHLRSSEPHLMRR